MEKKILTIAIPTYNRNEQIQKQIRLILPQLTDEVKLVVYDNCSEIPVKSLFNENELQLFTIIRNSVNIGGDANIARCFETCETEWLWTLSDDDYIRENGIMNVMQYVKLNKNATFINLWSPIEGITDNKGDFLKTLSNGATFSAAFAMSVCLYNMDILKRDLYFYYKNLSSMLGTLIMLIRNVMRIGGKCIWINNPPVYLNSEVGWNYRDFIERSFLFIQEFSDENIQLYNKTIFLGLYKTNYDLISLNRRSSHLSRLKRMRLFCKVTNKQGLFNALRFSAREYIRCLLILLLRPQRNTLG